MRRKDVSTPLPRIAVASGTTIRERSVPITTFHRAPAGGLEAGARLGEIAGSSGPSLIRDYYRWRTRGRSHGVGSAAWSDRCSRR